MIARHSVAIFAVSAALFGIGMGASDIYKISQYESHQHTTEGQR